jgi:hypothetical protein
MKKKLIITAITFFLSLTGYSFGAGNGGSNDSDKNKPGYYNYKKGVSLIEKGKRLEKKGKI